MASASCLTPATVCNDGRDRGIRSTWLEFVPKLRASSFICFSLALQSLRLRWLSCLGTGYQDHQRVMSRGPPQSCSIPAWFWRKKAFLYVVDKVSRSCKLTNMGFSSSNLCCDPDDCNSM
jgi:hypothetical protein